MTFFKEFGEIVSSKIMVDQNTGKSLGFGFVRFESSDSSQRAIKKMNGTQIQNKRLLCKLANQSHNNSEYVNILNHQIPSNNLFIKPLLPITTEDDLRKLFEKFGNIITCKVMIDHKTGLSKQIGFVKFESKEEASRALEEMTNYKLDENAPPLIVKYEDTKEQKLARKWMRMPPTSNHRGVPVQGHTGMPSVIMYPYPASPPMMYMSGGGGFSYPPYQGYEFYPFSPPSYAYPPFQVAGQDGGFTPGSPIYPYSWNPEYQPSPYGPGTAFPNSYSLSHRDNSDSVSDDNEHNGHDTNGHDTNGHDPNGHDPNGHDPNGHDPNEHDPNFDEDNGTQFPMFDVNEINRDDQNEEEFDKNGESIKYSSTKPINIRNRTDRS